VSDWIEIRALVDEAPEDWSIFADAFEHHGCPSSEIVDVPPSITGYVASVAGSEAQVEALVKVLRELGASQVDVRKVPEQDWSELWKIHFKTRPIGKRFVIRPTWEPEVRENGKLVITLDPGQAFGTGDHPTTRLCLELMEEIDLKGKVVADVGCGSGVLSIGACLLGATRVIATDLDPLAVEITRENATLNRVEIEADVAEGFAALGKVDVILSNIISAVLIRLTPDARSHLQKGGIWLVSGIIEANWPDVLSAAENSGFSCAGVRREDGWVGATLRLA
jgi:ribosomal protein L11 methyltransferase